jgi:hypothetical protein
MNMIPRQCGTKEASMRMPVSPDDLISTRKNGTSIDAASMNRRRFLGAIALGLASASRTIPAHAFAAADDLVAARKKLNAYSTLYAATHRFQASWERYARLVDLENGPTGKEMRLIGVTAPDLASEELAEAEKLLGAAPAVPEADRAAKALIHFYREAAPLMTEAAAFYPSYRPQDDLGRAGQEWHRRMKSLMTFTVDARRDLFKASDSLRAEVEPKELVVLERQGRGALWHVRFASVEARKVRDALPVSAGPFDPEMLKTNLARFTAVVESCQRFEQAHPGKLMMFAPIPNLFKMTMARLQSRIADGKDPRAVAAADILVAHTAYAQLLQFSELFFANAA